MTGDNNYLPASVRRPRLRLTRPNELPFQHNQILACVQCANDSLQLTLCEPSHRSANHNCSAAAQVQCTQREIIESLYVCSGCGAYLLTGSSVLLSAPDLPELSLIAP
eukprot:1797-Heterococcus_DN1.PRE.1